jgi:hypothetical protein
MYTSGESADTYLHVNAFMYARDLVGLSSKCMSAHRLLKFLSGQYKTPSQEDPISTARDSSEPLCLISASSPNRILSTGIST